MNKTVKQVLQAVFVFSCWGVAIFIAFNFMGVWACLVVGLLLLAVCAG